MPALSASKNGQKSRCPYIGAGLGYVTEIDLDLGGASPDAGEYSDRGLLAGQIILGADWGLADQWSLFGEIRYFATRTPKLSNDNGDTLEASYRTTDVLVGLTCRF